MKMFNDVLSTPKAVSRPSAPPSIKEQYFTSKRKQAKKLRRYQREILDDNRDDFENGMSPNRVVMKLDFSTALSTS
jgi:hypothetical protein